MGIGRSGCGRSCGTFRCGVFFLVREAARSANAFIGLAIWDSCFMKVMLRGQDLIVAARRSESGHAKGVFRALWRGRRERFARVWRKASLSMIHVISVSSGGNWLMASATASVSPWEEEPRTREEESICPVEVMVA